MIESLRLTLDSRGAVSTGAGAGPLILFRMREMEARYGPALAGSYIVAALVGAVIFERSRAQKDEKGAVRLNALKVAMWAVVFCIPLIVYIFMRPSQA